MFKKTEKCARMGGYPLVYIERDDTTLCPRCAMVVQHKVSSFIHWEGEPIECERCGKAIESAYGVPEMI